MRVTAASSSPATGRVAQQRQRDQFDADRGWRDRLVGQPGHLVGVAHDGLPLTVPLLAVLLSTLVAGLLVVLFACFTQPLRVQHASGLLLQGLVTVRAEAGLLTQGDLVQRAPLLQTSFT